MNGKQAVLETDLGTIVIDPPAWRTPTTSAIS